LLILVFVIPAACNILSTFLALVLGLGFPLVDILEGIGCAGYENPNNLYHTNLFSNNPLKLLPVA
jgi:hypothetical protein